nr:hypothetical protein [Candidatus Baldrarchaeota archaeon]
MDRGNKLKGKDAYIIEKAINEGWLKVFVFVCWAVTWSETFEHLYALYLKFSVCKPECPFGAICGAHATRDVRSVPEGNDEGSRVR